MTTWRRIDKAPSYEMNRRGQIRHRRSLKIKTVRDDGLVTLYVSTPGRWFSDPRRFNADTLYREVWGEKGRRDG